MNANQNIHFLLGKLEAADEWIEYLSNKTSPLMRQKLAEAKTARAEVVDQINELADNSIIIPLQQDEERSAYRTDVR